MLTILLFLGLLGSSCGGAGSVAPEDASRGNEKTGETTSTAGATIGGATGATTPEPTAPTSVAETQPPEEPAVEATVNTPDVPAVGGNGMVSSAHPLATKAGLEVLADGGNAFDAAVAVAAALNVVEPMMSGAGGYGALVVYDAEEGETRYLDAGSRFPASTDPSIFRPPTPGYEANRCGAPAVSAPANVDAWEKLSEEYGELRWDRLFEPAISYAEDGFAIDGVTAGWIGSEYPAFPENAREIYGRDGVPLGTGETLVQRDLAGSLRLISREGADAVHGGALGGAMASTVQEGGGFLTLEDTRDNRAEWLDTISIDYRGNEVVTASPPSTSWGMLLRLGVMSRFDLSSSDHNTSGYIHALTETSKQGAQAAREYAADPPFDLLLSEDYWAKQAANMSPYYASPYEPFTTVDSAASCSPTSYTPTGPANNAQANSQGYTTHYVVADGEGNVVSSTQTLGNVFGSKVMPEGTGLWLNDATAWSRFEPVGNVFDVYPGRKSLYALCPVIVLRDGRPTIALGTPGGRTIPQTTTQMLTNMVEFDMDVQNAVSAPRTSFVIPDILAVEEGISQPVRDDLVARGHNVRSATSALGNAHALAIEYDERGRPIRFTGGADPRGAGSAAGY
ncbi:MAG: gamma-glutamyltransferase [Actinomycetota bacterium]|nr:gamma-glutamyltransferase [Actinomycetota bacterium]